MHNFSTIDVKWKKSLKITHFIVTSKIKWWRHIMILITALLFIKIFAYVIIVYNLVVFWLFEFLN